VTVGAPALELWHEWNSVHSFKVRIVLAEKGLEWISHPVALLRLEHLQPAYLAINPDGVVPTLVHHGRRLYDSSPICEYLDETFPEPRLMPSEPWRRVEARRWLKYHDDVAHGAVRDASFQLLYKPHLAGIPPAEREALLARHPRPERRRKFLDGAAPGIDRDALQAALAACDAVAARVDAHVRQGPWLLGADFTLADVAMAPFAERVENLGAGFVWDGRPAGRAWAERLLARATVQASRAPEAFRLPVPDAAALAGMAPRRPTENDRCA
jgi:glutathione S-transferase